MNEKVQFKIYKLSKNLKPQTKLLTEATGTPCFYCFTNIKKENNTCVLRFKFFWYKPNIINNVYVHIYKSYKNII